MKRNDDGYTREIAKLFLVGWIAMLIICGLEKNTLRPAPKAPQTATSSRR